MVQEQGYTNHDDFQVLEFYCSFTQSKAHLSDGIDRPWTLRMNKDS